ncbi:MAG TPA: hypothetical protein VJ718_10290 [Candidatus Binataceae bacterium]|jgi:Flp pilus assembly pilin Flp|nr:hypothetical protein [Candidatus Binataceae bacterium]
MDAFRYLSNQIRESLQGQTMAEYAFVVAAIAIAVIGSYKLMGGELSFLVNHLGSDVASAS